jgi:hypothetical protein
MDENKFLREKGFKYILEEQPCSWRTKALVTLGATMFLEEK